MGFAKLAVPALTCSSLSCSPLSTDKRTYQCLCLLHHVQNTESSQNEQHCAVRRAQATLFPCATSCPLPQAFLAFSWAQTCSRSQLRHLHVALDLVHKPPFLKLFLLVAPQAVTKLPHPHLCNASHLHLGPLFHLCTPKCWCYKASKNGFCLPFWFLGLFFLCI